MDLRYILQQQEIDITDGLIKQMLVHIGSTDPELRDTFIYTRFQDWIIAKQLSQEQLNLVLASSLKNSLHRLGDSESDTVFARSFSVLLCALVLAYSSVTKDVYIRSFDVGRTYMEKEQDLRGHVEEKGWAHGIAHGADLLTVLASHRFFELDQIESLLVSIKTPLLKETVFIDDEQERLTAPVLALIDRFDHEVSSGLTSWIRSIEHDVRKQKEEAIDLSFFHNRTNAVHFLMALYFALQTRTTPFIQEFQEQLEQTIQSLRQL